MKANVLVVEDNPVNRELLVALLESWGHAPVVAEDGLQAMAVLRETTVDLVICDIQMPRMDGYEFILHVRESLPARSSLPAIALTAFAMPSDREAALSHGFDEYHSKPIDPRRLRSQITELLERRDYTLPLQRPNAMPHKDA